MQIATARRRAADRRHLRAVPSWLGALAVTLVGYGPTLVLMAARAAGEHVSPGTRIALAALQLIIVALVMLAAPVIGLSRWGVLWRYPVWAITPYLAELGKYCAEVINAELPELDNLRRQ